MDRVLGTAQLKLDMLETACEVHEILEVSWQADFKYSCVTGVRAPAEDAALAHTYSFRPRFWMAAGPQGGGLR